VKRSNSSFSLALGEDIRLDKGQKIAEYYEILATFRSEVAHSVDVMKIYMTTIDLLFKLSHINWCGIYFFNDVTKEFYLGYYRDQPTNTSVIRLNQLSLKQPRNKLDLCNNVKAEGKISSYIQAASEIKVLFRQQNKIYGLIATSSKQENIFDDIDEKYLLEVVETIVERVQY
jgi:putative methionine-R-sulfoxide reductase with GAF domain